MNRINPKNVPVILNAKMFKITLRVRLYLHVFHQLYKGNTFHDFLFAAREDAALQRASTLKGKNLPLKEQNFPKVLSPIKKEGKKVELVPLEVYTQSPVIIN